MPQSKKPAGPAATAGQVSLADKARKKSPQKKKAPQKKPSNKTPIARNILSLVLIVIMIFSILALVWMVQYVYETWIDPEETVKSVDLKPFETTPENLRDSVAYYLVGLLGDDSEDDTPPLESLMLVCHDKTAKTLNVLQLPQDTWLGGDASFATHRLADVWSHPSPQLWCPYVSCRHFVDAEDVDEDGNHTVCGEPVTEQPGWPGPSLCDFVNQHLGLPIDAWFILQPESLSKLVTLFDGIDLHFDSDIEINDITYRAGNRIVTGDAALYKATHRPSNDIAGDISRMVSGRQVYLALFQHLMGQSEKQLNNDSIVPLQAGSTPIKTNLTRGEIVRILLEMQKHKIGPGAVTTWVMPGQSAKTEDGKTVYSANKAALLALLNEHFRPAGAKLTETDLEKLGELGTPAEEPEMHEQNMAELAVPQTRLGETAATTQTQ